METYSYVDDQDERTELESISDRLTFLFYEWTLLIGWIASLLLVWRVTCTAIIERYFAVSSIRLGIIVAVMVLMIGCAYALTMTGRWLLKRPTPQSLLYRWGSGIFYLVVFTALGRMIVWWFVDMKS